MTTVQALSVVFLLVMVMLIIRGARGHARRKAEGGDLDATGRAVAGGIIRRSEQLDSITTSSSGGADGGD